ncbi:phage portal protein [Selenomonas ruminantium]|uniref:Phage portal protein BeeE n=1 Tax=Selenomonas ruminantium TaxID=971 RepID=A0A1I0YC40_SELRU|nr:phage portal protein [Selenomonas ruminantium]SFB09958.1 Phage portal protein BeeE [Selenomonas ruminantium]
MFDHMKKYLASKGPLARLLPNQTYMSWIPHGKKKKQVLPKNPTIRQLRNFSRDPIVRKAITIVQDALSRQPYTIDVIGGRGKHIREIAAVQNCIEHPNLVDSRASFTKRVLDDAMVLDAMCAEVAKASNPSHPVYLYPVDGSTIQMVVPYDYTDDKAARYMQQQADGMKYFTAQDIAYLQRAYFTYQPYGLSPVMMAYNYVKFYLDAIEQANEKATNATAEFLISLGEGVTAAQREEFIEYMANSIEGTGRIPVVAGAKSVETKQIKAINSDGLYLQWLEKLTQIVGVAFGIPPEKLGLVIANDRNTGEDQESSMIQELVKPYAAMLEDLYNNYVIAGMGLGGVLKFRFIFEDSENQKSVKSKRVVDEYYKGVLTENEVRRLMGYEESTSVYADMTYPEKTTKINVDYGVSGGFNGVGNIKDTSEEGGDNGGKE